MLNRFHLYQRTFATLLEHQSKKLFSEAQLPVQKFVLFERKGTSFFVPSMLSNPRQVVVKAMVPAGGRGRGTWIDDQENKVLDSGIHLKSGEDVKEINDLIDLMLDPRYQLDTRGQGKHKCEAVMVAEAVDIKDEMYIAFMPCRKGVKVIVNRRGGVSVEESPETGAEVEYKTIGRVESEDIAEMLGSKELSPIIQRLYEQVWCKSDLTLLEINPLALTPNGPVLVDAKIELDDAALFRHQEIQVEKQSNFVDIPEGGNVGCIVNGAGLAMATMDSIYQAGGRPANFLDIGGTADVKSVEESVIRLLKEPKVKTVFVNIFGGIVRTDEVAQGILNALKATDSNTKPLVVRLVGSNYEIGTKMLECNPVPNSKIILQSDFKQATETAVRLTQ